jgi:diguanylate cyclase (GGDEF)-like protein
MTELYLIMMDINYFKRINDTYGHVEGDKALKLVAHILKTIGGVYKSDLFIARFGGDEFSAVFESESEKRVRQLCSDIKDSLKRDTEDRKYRLTIGAGFALYTGRSMTIDELYERADKALYEDKDRMKNLITDEL